MAESLSGKAAVITGGASGIGAATAEALLKLGMYVVVGDLESQRPKAQELIGKHPAGRIVFVPCDVTKKADLEALAAAAAALPSKGASLWYNNAGIATEGFGEGDEDILSGGSRWRLMQEININAVIEGTQVAYLHMKSCKVAGEKFIVATASMAGLLATPGPIYGANKAAVVHFTRSLAERFFLALDPFDKDMYCYAICPTFTETPLFRQGSERMQRATIRSVGGLARAEDLANGVVDLVTQRPLSGSICRVTLRGNGKQVVRDLMPYGKEAGGNFAGPPREGQVLGVREIDAAEKQQNMPAAKPKL